MNDRPIMGFDVGADGAAIVVTVQPDGSYRVQNDNVCSHLAAELLHGIADRLAAEHPPYPCKPRPAAQRPREDEAADPRGGHLDRDRGVWRDPRGDAFDLTLLWGDRTTDREWRWHGSTDRLGEPLLRAEGDGEVLPIGALRSLYGPLTPLPGGAA